QGELDEQILTVFISLLEYRSLHLQFDCCFQQSMLDFSRKSNIPISHYRGCDFSYDPPARYFSNFNAASLPRMLELNMARCNGLSDQDSLNVVRKEHYDMSFRGYFGDISTLRRIIEIVRTSELINRVIVGVSVEHFRNFLFSIGLIERENKFMDVKNPNETVEFLELNGELIGMNIALIIHGNSRNANKENRSIHDFGYFSKPFDLSVLYSRL
ncbi:hypothetical protein PFISCL1PPCAC_24985, partial [Pristionchus fissidentatus]